MKNTFLFPPLFIAIPKWVFSCYYASILKLNWQKKASCPVLLTSAHNSTKGSFKIYSFVKFKKCLFCARPRYLYSLVLCNLETDCTQISQFSASLDIYTSKQVTLFSLQNNENPFFKIIIWPQKQ